MTRLDDRRARTRPGDGTAATSAVIGTLCFGALLFTPRTALPCGGGFGDGLHINPAQKIAIAYDGKRETYVFSPHFCGRAADFGLILPVPNGLTANPTLADKDLIAQLERHTAPTVVEKKVCAGLRAGGGNGLDAGSYAGDSGTKVNVINRGRVGMFDWVLLKADDATAFTDWLDTNQFPYDKGTLGHFTHYVNQGWYFVAFKVTADSKAPPAGSEICGDLGPLSLTFSSSEPVLPARIAAVESSYRYQWRVFVVAAAQQRVKGNASVVYSQLRFSGALGAADLTKYPAIAQLARAGQRVTKLDLTFSGASIKDDILFEAQPGQKDFRQQIVRYIQIPCDDAGTPIGDAGPLGPVSDAGIPGADPASGPSADGDDGGCSAGGSPGGSPWTALLLGMLAALARTGRRRRRRRAR